MKEVISFSKFLSTYYSWFDIDVANHDLIQRLGLWAIKSSQFETNNFFLEKSIVLLGNVGSGKTELMRLLNKYMQYIGSPYIYKSATVPAFVSAFQQQGEEVFIKLNSSNWFLDELGNTTYITTDSTPSIELEWTNYYGNKILMGSSLILRRYNVFKNSGWQTHFTSNLSELQLKNVYGERAYSRLLEMANIFTYIGPDRRRDNNRPIIYANEDNTFKRTYEETLDDTKIIKTKINSLYHDYINGSANISPFDFDVIFMQLGVVLDEDEYGKVGKDTFDFLKLYWERFIPTSPQTNKTKKRILAEYEAGMITDPDELSKLKAETKRTYVKQFFSECKKRGDKNIFGE